MPIVKYMKVFSTVFPFFYNEIGYLILRFDSSWGYFLIEMKINYNKGRFKGQKVRWPFIFKDLTNIG